MYKQLVIDLFKDINKRGAYYEENKNKWYKDEHMKCLFRNQKSHEDGAKELVELTVWRGEYCVYYNKFYTTDYNNFTIQQAEDHLAKYYLLGALEIKSDFQTRVENGEFKNLTSWYERKRPKDV